MAQPRSPYKVQAEVYRALAHPTRLQILDILRDGEACVCHIQAVLRRRQAYISQHLMALRDAGLVTSRKDGLRMYYQLSDVQLRDVLDEVRQIAFAQAGQTVPANPNLTPAPGRCNCPQCSQN